MEREVRSALREVADGVRVRPLSGPALRLRVHRRRQHTIGVAMLTVAVLGLVVAAPRLVPFGGDPAHYGRGRPSSGTYLTWPSRGDLADEPEYGAAAVSAWDRSPRIAGHGPHADVRALYAAATDYGPIVVLTGVDRDGERRIALLRGRPRERTFSGAMVVEDDRRAPPPEDTRAFALWAVPAPDSTATTPTAFAAVVAEPDLTFLLWTKDGRTANVFHGFDGVGWGMPPQGSAVVRGLRGSDERRFEFSTYPVYFPYEDLSHPPSASAVRTSSEDDWFTVRDNGLREAAEVDAYQIADAALVRRERGVLDHLLSVVWRGRLPDGTDLFMVELQHQGDPARIVLGARQDQFVDLYLDTPRDALYGRRMFAVVVRGAEQDWLVVAGRPGVTSVSYAADGTAFADLTTKGGVAVLGVRRGSVTAAARVLVRAGREVVYDGPLDALRPLV